jgi:sphingolipid delta-4 desaturase
LFAVSQVGVAVAVVGGPWWLVCVAAYLVGAWINICLFNLAHECNHELVLGNRRWDRWLFTLTTLPMFLPGHHTWWIEHHVHHNDLGAKKDFVKRRRSILLAMKDSLLGGTMPHWMRPFASWLTTPLFWPIAALMLVTQLFRAVVGLVLYAVTALFTWRLRPSDRALAILADQHLVSGYDRYRIRSWSVIYPLMSLGLLAVLFALGGWKPVVYLFLSALFMTGFLHPVMFGLILSNSHFHGHREYQPSSSYYGWLNWITFNFGLHTEHHDLAAVPWHRLPKLREIAPEYYDDLLKTPSYPLLAFRFAFASREAFDNEEYRNAEMLKAAP